MAEFESFAIEVGKKDKGKQLVIVLDRTLKTEIHRDRIDVNSANARSRRQQSKILFQRLWRFTRLKSPKNWKPPLLLPPWHQ